jgi:hypothetical protein
VLANDSAPGVAGASATLATRPGHGTLTLRPDGAFVYVPDAGFAGTDRFTYLAEKGHMLAGPVTVVITVVPQGGVVPASAHGPQGGLGPSDQYPFDVPGSHGTDGPVFAAFGMLGFLSLSFEWVVPGLLLAVPGLLLLGALAIQTGGGAVWLPFVRRFVGRSRFTRRRRQPILIPPS